MIASVRNAERYRKLIARTLTWRNPPLTPDATTKAITKLATLVSDYDGDTDALWALGEDEINLADLLIGAYAYYSEHYGSQWCDEYKALSALSAVVDGGYTTLQTCATTDMDSSQQIVYDALVEIN